MFCNNYTSTDIAHVMIELQTCFSPSIAIQASKVHLTVTPEAGGDRNARATILTGNIGTPI